MKRFHKLLALFLSLSLVCSGPAAYAGQAAARIFSAKGLGIHSLGLPVHAGLRSGIGSADLLSTPLKAAGGLRDFSAKAQLRGAGIIAALADQQSEEIGSAQAVLEQSKIEQDKYWTNSADQGDRAPAARTAQIAAVSAVQRGQRLPLLKRLAVGAGTVLLPSTALAAQAQASAPSWIGDLWSQLQPFAIALSIFKGADYIHKIAKSRIDQLDVSSKTRNTLNGVSAIATGFLGLTFGLKAMGVPPATLATAFVIGAALNLQATVGNIMNGLLFLKNKPFALDEVVRLEDSLYKVAEMKVTQIKFEAIGKLIEKALPEHEKNGNVIIPFNSVDPLGRDSDENGFGLVAKPGPNEAKFRWFSYNQLNLEPITLFRLDAERLYQFRHQEKIKFNFFNFVTGSKIKLIKLLNAAKEMPKMPFIKAAIWTASAFAAHYASPHFLSASITQNVIPYIQAGLIVIAARAWENGIVGLINHMHLSYSDDILAKFITRLTVYAAGTSFAVYSIAAALPSLTAGLGKFFGATETKIGLPIAAAIVAKEIGQMLLRLTYKLLSWPLPFDKKVRVGKVVGMLKEFDMYSVRLISGQHAETLVPWPIAEFYPLDDVEPAQDKLPENYAFSFIKKPMHWINRLWRMLTA